MDVAVTGITKRRIGAAAVMDYFSLIPNLLYNDNGQGGFRGPMKSSIVKRSIVVDGHKTSVSLEDPFWIDLKKIAHTQQATLSGLIAKIDATREQGNLSSAIRLFVLQHFRNEDKRMEAAKAHLSAVGAEGTASQP
jgi:predicted DNA-binding ribbon-helix-helix protein